MHKQFSPQRPKRLSGHCCNKLSAFVLSSLFAKSATTSRAGGMRKAPLWGLGRALMVAADLYTENCRMRLSAKIKLTRLSERLAAAIILFRGCKPLCDLWITGLPNYTILLDAFIKLKIELLLLWPENW
jgi:hypothetical protein